jgi:hypothetical protein
MEARQILPRSHDGPRGSRGGTTSSLARPRRFDAVAIPQMQTFNAGVWLNLENYMLFHARQYGIAISVLSGRL